MRALAPLTVRWVLAAAIVGGTCAHAEPVVVVSVARPVSALTADEVTQIFLGKVDVLSSGVRVAPVDQPDGSPVRNDFYSQIIGKSSAQLRAYWSRLIFTGRGQPPRELPDLAAIRRALAAGGDVVTVAYVERSKVSPDMRIVYTR